MNAVYKYSMPAIRHYSHNGSAATLGDIPGGKAFLKTKTKPMPGQPRSASPVEWLGFICKAGARRLPIARPGKLVASYITNGDFLAHDWKPLRADQYVLGMIMQISDTKFGAFAIVDRDGWPIVRSETSPLLTVVTEPKRGQIVSFSKRQG